MRLGVIGAGDVLVVAQKDRPWKVHEFAISVSELSFFQIMHSAFSTPARYILEMFRRLDCLEEGAAAKPLFIFNPLFHTDRVTMMLVLTALRDDVSSDQATVVTDGADRPIGYLFPAWLDRKRLHLLTLLSTTNGEVDARLICLLFHIKVKCHSLAPLDLKRAHHNGFLYEQTFSIFRWLAMHSIAYMESKIADGEDQEWQEARFTAIMPRHAGDVLFFSLAYAGGDSHVTGIAVNTAYRDIVVKVAPRLLVFDIVPQVAVAHMNSSQAATEGESDHFDKYKDTLPLDGFYYFSRQSRDANASVFHLIDQFSFALGASCCTRKDLVVQQGLIPPSYRPEAPSGNTNVLLHFDGGWPLKVYPQDQQERLIDLLSARGFSVTVLAARSYLHPKCQVTTFKSFASLLGLLESSHLIVGMDSFPVHYAIFVQGLPTICLFANTRPENSCAPPVINYSRLEVGLICRPCNGVSQCPLFGRDKCSNFVNPERIVDEVVRMLDAVGRSDQKMEGSVPRSFVDVDSCRPRPGDMNRRAKNISLRNVGAKVKLYRTVSPAIGLLSFYYREFSASARIDGFLGATLRTLRFFRRISRR